MYSVNFVDERDALVWGRPPLCVCVVQLERASLQQRCVFLYINMCVCCGGMTHVATKHTRVIHMTHTRSHTYNQHTYNTPTTHIHTQQKHTHNRSSMVGALRRTTCSTFAALCVRPDEAARSGGAADDNQVYHSTTQSGSTPTFHETFCFAVYSPNQCLRVREWG